MSKSRHESPLPEQWHVLDHADFTPNHRHDRGHLVYPARGTLSIVTGGGSWVAPPNRVVWIPAHCDHEHRAYGVTDMRIVFFSADDAALLPDHPTVLTMTALAREAVLALTGDGDDGSGGDASNCVVGQDHVGEGAVGESAVTASVVREGARRRRRSAQQRQRLRRVVVDEIAVAEEQPLHLPTPSDDRLRAAVAVIEADLATALTLDQVGRTVGASARTLTRLLREETGMSYRQWRTQIRVHHALLLLAEGVSVTRVASECGWATTSSFIEAFTALVGRTPGEHQRSTPGWRND